MVQTSKVCQAYKVLMSEADCSEFHPLIKQSSMTSDMPFCFFATLACFYMFKTKYMNVRVTSMQVRVTGCY